MENVRREAVYQVKNKRGHACFIGWSGNNENYSMYEGHIKNAEKPFPFYGKRFTGAGPICAAYDPERPFRLSSPWGGDCADDIREGDQHFWGTYHDFHELYGDFFRIAESRPPFVSEFGMIAPLNLESLKKCCDADQLYPQSEQWRFHSNTGDNFEKILSQYFGAAEPLQNDPARAVHPDGAGHTGRSHPFGVRQVPQREVPLLRRAVLDVRRLLPHLGLVLRRLLRQQKAALLLHEARVRPGRHLLQRYNPNALQGMREYRAHYAQNGAALRIALTRRPHAQRFAELHGPRDDARGQDAPV